MEFPMSVLLKSNDNNKFLCYRKKEGGNHSSLKFSQEEDDENVEIQYLKFEIQEAKSVEGLVHIRNCYNHKYWVRKSADSKWIVAEANEPDEDKSKSTCTLFKLIPVDGDEPLSECKPQRIRLMHIDHLGQHYAFMSKSTGDDHASELALSDEDSASKFLSANDFTLYNVSSRVVLPEVVVFKGHNGRYCSPITIGGSIYMELNAADIAQEGVIHHVFNSPPPSTGCRIDNPLTGYYWLLAFSSSNVIAALPAGSASIHVRQALLVAISLGSNIIAFRAQTVDRLIQTVSALNRENMLQASATTLVNQTRFQVEEPVLRRVVSNVQYDLANSRIYGVTSVTKFSDSRGNGSSVEQTGTFRVSYRTSQASNWNHGVTINTGISANLSVRIPFVGSFGVELSAERSQQREWGVEEVEERTIEYEQNLTIPPGRRIGLHVVASQGFCDVPFTCEVSDTLSDGTVRTYTKTDGLFEGSNEYNFQTLITEEVL